MKSRFILLCTATIIAVCFIQLLHVQASEAQSVKHVKVLAVGNSFSNDATTYFPQLVEGSPDPCQLTLERASIGGCDLERHLRHANTYEKNPDDPEGKPYHNKTKSLKELLLAEKWDFVTIQQASPKSFKPETYRPFARELRDYIKKYAPQGEVVIHQTWTYRADEPRFGTDFCASQEAMFRGLCDAYSGIAKELDLRLVRSGDALELARRSPDWGGVFPVPGFDSTKAVYPELPDQSRSLHVGFSWKKSADTWKLQYDGIHANPAGDYLLGCVWFEFFFEKSPVDITFVPSVLKPEDARILRQIAHEVPKYEFGLTSLKAGSSAEEINEKDCSLTVNADRDDAKYRTGENIVFQIQLRHKNQPLPGKELKYTITGDGGYQETGNVLSGEKAVSVEAKLNRPGMIRCEVQWKTPAGKVLTAHAGAAVDPLKIVPARPEPEDFDQFWAEQKERLDAVPMNPRLVPFEVEKYKPQGVEVFDVQVDCLGDAPVSGYLVKPIDAKPASLPIVVNYHGAGVYSANVPLVHAKKGAIAFDVNAHGLPNGRPKSFYEEQSAGPLKNYSRREGSEKYFVGMYLRVIRSLEFVKSLPEWDGKILAVTGSSQGGGQALAAAGLDPDVNICCAYVPALCYHSGHVDKEFGGWSGFLRDRELTPELIRQVAYIDAAILSKRSKAESLLTVGYVDYTCSATSIYVAYNNLPGPKQILEYPQMAHSTPGELRNRGNAFIWNCIENAQKTTETNAE